VSRKRFPPELTLSVTAIDSEGVGEARFGEKAVRVKGGLPGEELIARTVGRRKGAALAVAQTLLSDPAAERQTAYCSVFPRCGGCALQHMTYDAQLAHKEQGLLHALRANGIAFGELHPPVSSPQFGYRRKARLGVRRLHEMQLVGFREAFGGRIVKMERCPALAAPFDTLFPDLAQLIGGLSIPASVPQLETAVGDNAAALVLRHLEPLAAADVRALGEFQTQHNVLVYTQAEGYDSVTPLLRDAPMLNYSHLEYGVSLQFEPTDFIQVNQQVNAALVRAVVASLQPGPGQRIADMFCGIGNFSLPLARRGADVLGWEASPTAIHRARSNAERNQLTGRCLFEVADLYAQPGDKKQQTPLARIEGVSALVLDPPRSGAGPALASWLNKDVEKIAYVSCNPVTFASDAVVLAGAGFELSDVGIYDMFPHTAHVETFGMFIRRG